MVVGLAMFLPGTAQAQITDVFDGDVSCTVRADDVRLCGAAEGTLTETFDGVPLDVTAAFPPEPASGPDGPYPLVMMFHGYGGGKLGIGDMQPWLDKGYATFSMSDRGFHESCGSATSRAADPDCQSKGYIRLIDNRFEVRDAQFLAGELADEGLIQPRKIGAVGGSYGGGMSMALGALKDRVVMPDYSLVPWTSPDGKPMQIAAAAPNVPWTDLAYSLVPNGSTLDYLADAPYEGPPGIMKQSYVNGLYLSGLLAPGYYVTPGEDPTADLVGWKATLDAGEPYGPDARDAIDELSSHHSSYGIDHSQPPAPMLMSSGFTDDLFPADETIRYYNRTLTQYPDADLALFFGDFGHARGQNKSTVTGALTDRVAQWFDYFVKGEGAKPDLGVTAYTQTCPAAADDGGPYQSGSWAKIAPGEVRFADRGKHTIAPGSNTSGAFNPITDSSPCSSEPADDPNGAAVYEIDPAPAGGYTLLGATTVIANFSVSGSGSQVAARLLDVAPDGTETLVNRGLWRLPDGTSKRKAFQLHPNGWHFAEGHVPKLELLASDSTGVATNSIGNYGRPSNDQQPVTVRNLEVRLPVIERPGAKRGVVAAPARKVLKGNQELAAEFAALKHPQAKLAGKRLRLKGKRLRARVRCPGAFQSCNDVHVRVRAKQRHRGKQLRFKVGQTQRSHIKGGERVLVQIRATNRARRYLRRHGKLKVSVAVRSSENKGAARKNATATAKRKKRRR